MTKKFGRDGLFLLKCQDCEMFGWKLIVCIFTLTS